MLSCTSATPFGKDRQLAKPNYQFAKRQRDLAKKQKKEEKRQRKSETGDTPAAENPPTGENPPPLPADGKTPPDAQ